MQIATLVWKTKVSEVCDLKQGKQVLAERMEEHSQRNRTGKWSMVSDERQFAVSSLDVTEEHCGQEVHPIREGMYIT